MLKIYQLPLALFAVAVVQPGNAQAEDVLVQVGGGLHVGADVHLNVDAALDMVAEVNVGWSAGWGVELDFADPPPPLEAPCDAQCYGAVSSYGVALVPVTTVYIAPPVQTVVVPYMDGGVQERHVPRQERRWGLGAFAGSMSTRGMESGSDLGLFAQYRFSQAIRAELELAKSKQADGGRVDRRVGGAILYNLTPHRRLSPFLLMGAGYGQSEIAAGEFHAQQGYGEVGAGLRLRLTPSIHIVGDLRSGRRSTKDGDVYMSKSSMSGASVEEDEGYTRLRVGGLISF